MEFNQTTTIGIFLAIVLASVGGALATPMGTSTVLMMVAPSVLVFGAICLFLGIKHGEHRAGGI